MREGEEGCERGERDEGEQLTAYFALTRRKLRRQQRHRRRERESVAVKKRRGCSVRG